jgi:hypothetical protein
MDDFYCYDIEHEVWEKVHAEGTKPKAREMNTSHIY